MQIWPGQPYPPGATLAKSLGVFLNGRAEHAPGYTVTVQAWSMRLLRRID